MTVRVVRWRVAPAPTGPYRSFQYRAWPSAEVNGHNAFNIVSASHRCYTKTAAETPFPDDLILYVAVWRPTEDGRHTYDWKPLRGRNSTFMEIRERAAKLVNERPELFGNLFLRGE